MRKYILFILFVLSVNALKGQYADQANPMDNKLILEKLNSIFKKRGIIFRIEDFSTPPDLRKVGRAKYDLILSKTRPGVNTLMLNNLFGRIYYNEQSILLAGHFFLRARALLNGNAPYSQRAITYANLGDYYRKNREPEKALLYYGKIVDLPESSLKKLNRYRILNAQVNTLLELDRPNDAIALNNRIITAHALSSDTDLIYFHFSQGRLSALANDTTGSKAHYLRCLKLSKNLPELQYDCNRELGVMYLKNGNAPAALEYLLAAEKISAADSFSDKGQLEGLISETYVKLGNYRLAHHHLVQKKMFKDSLFTIQRPKNLLELEFRYDNFKKDLEIRANEKSIRLLGSTEKLLEEREKEELIQFRQSALALEQKKIELNSRQKSMTLLDRALNFQKSQLEWDIRVKRILFLAFLLLAGLLLVLYRLYRFKSSSNRLIEKKNESLKFLLAEKTWLVKEMHERIRMNLETIITLLKPPLQETDCDAVAALQVSENRVFAMSLIHQKLFDTSSFHQINISEYVSNLVKNLTASFSVSRQVEITFFIEEIFFDPEQVVPLGIIINECITNSFKYAFSGRRKGSICISLKKTGPHRSSMCIADNGTGFPSAVNIQKTSSLGLKLIRGLARQMGGEVEIISDNGTTVTIYNLLHVVREEGDSEKDSNLATTDSHSAI